MEIVQILLVREKDQQFSGSGCCGRLEGDILPWSRQTAERLFCENRSMMEQMGGIYRKLDEDFSGLIELEVIDPRNVLFLFAELWRTWRRKRLPWLQRVRYFAAGFRAAGIFIDGTPVAAESIADYKVIRTKVNEALTAGGRE